MLVEKKVFHSRELLLQSGQVLHDLRIGFETYGKLNEAGDNAVLITHYFSGTSHAAGRYHEQDAEPGYWDAIIGPGKAIDTDRYFVIASDCLSNMNVFNPMVTATGPASINPATNRPYGAHFPMITIGDYVTVQHQLCEFLGVRRFAAVAGPSMGSINALEWAARFPDKVSRVIACIAPGLSTPAYLIATLNAWCAPILLDPAFRGGDYLLDQQPIRGLTEAFKLVSLTAQHHGWAQRLYGRRIGDPAHDPAMDPHARFSIEDALEKMGYERARLVDANSVLRIVRAVQLFSIEGRKRQLRSRFLFLPAASDVLMFPAYSDRGVADLRALGLSVESFTIEGDGGHLDGLSLISQATNVIRTFMESENVT